MRLISKPKNLQKWILQNKKANQSLGFVPTMGDLHEGHLSLVKKARTQNNLVVVSIFVNPLQFGPKEDFKKYPRRLKQDAALLKELEVDVLFCPKPPDFYPNDFQTEVQVKNLAIPLCGQKRPGHFAGVTTVVSKLFLLTKPTRAYFGQKDFQQLAIIRRMVLDLSFDIKIIGLPIVREKNGLAMSSRNRYLNESEHKSAPKLFFALKSCRQKIKKENLSLLQARRAALYFLKQDKQIKVEYLEFVDVDNLTKLKNYRPKKTLLAIAALVGSTRLIDNLVF